MLDTQGIFRASKTVQNWKRFQETQSSRWFPRKEGGKTEVLKEALGWQLDLSSVENIPVLVQGCQYKLNFTFFDLETKTFFGNTLGSESTPPSFHEGSWKCSLNNKSIHFWSQFSLDKSVLVTELIKVQLDKYGVECLEESVGWVPVPLNILSGEQRERNQGRVFQVPLLEGTPRILSFSGVTQGKPLGDCKILFSIKHSQEFLNTCSRLIPDSCIVDSKETIPGCVRFDANGRETFLPFDFITPLDPPQASPAVGVTIRNIHVSLPPNYIESVLGELLRDVDDWFNWLKNNFYIRVSAHNGKTEVKGTSATEKLKFMKLAQDTHLKLDTNIQLSGIPEDEYVALVVEIFLNTASISGEKLCMGWLPLDLFLDEDGEMLINSALVCGPGRFIDGSALLNWEAMIEEDPKKPAFGPTVYCQVKLSERTPRVLQKFSKASATVPSLDQSMSRAANAAAPTQERIEAEKKDIQHEEVKTEAASDNSQLTEVIRRPSPAAAKEEEESKPEPKLTRAVSPVPEKARPKRLPEALEPKPKLEPISTVVVEPPAQKQSRPRPRPLKTVLARKTTGKTAASVNTEIPAKGRKENAPPVVLALPKESGVSRATKAKMKLQDLPLPTATGGENVQKKTHSETEVTKDSPILEKENVDSKLVNEVIVQLLAYKAEKGDPSESEIRSLYFTLNFFDFKESSTRKVALERSGDSDIYLFKSLKKAKPSDSEGLTLKFKVDNEDVESLKERKENLCQYLLHKKLQLNVWNGESMFQQGFAMVDLRPLLRQGKDFVEQLQEVQIRKTDGLTGENQTKGSSLEQLGGNNNEMSKGFSNGSLILRLINVGSDKDTDRTSNNSVNIDDSKRSLLRRPEMVMQEFNMNPNQSGPLIHQLIEIEKRRFKRKERYMGHHVSDNYELSYKIRQKLHQDVCHLKEMQRELLIKSKLRQKLVGKKMLKARVGEVLFFEQKFTNPRGCNKTFRIDVSDKELSLVLNADEWAHLRSLKKNKTKMASAPENDILDGNRLFLGSFDECHVPFKYCPLDFPSAVDAVTEKVICVSLVCEKTGTVESQLEILIEVQPCIIDKTLVLHTPELATLKHSIPLDAAGFNISSTRGGGDAQVVVTNDQNVVAKLQEEEGQNKELLIKCSKSGTAPQERDFLTFFYEDKYQTRLLHVWKFCVHTVKKLDLTGLTGQTTISSLVVKGTASSQKVRCFTSHPEELQVVPRDFTLISDSLSELKISYCPLAATRLNAMLNIVNAESGKLVQSILLSARAEDPPVSKTYELQVVSGTVHESKISYENSWATTKKFSFKPAHPWLVKIQPGMVELEAGALGVVGVSFRALDLDPGMYETLVFINDVDNNNEDCCRILIKVLPSQGL